MNVELILDATKNLQTPVAVVDEEQLQHNLIHAADCAAEGGFDFFPHAKSHKTIEVALRQLELGARGLTCQTLGEAEVMLAAKPPELVIPVPITTGPRLARLTALAEQVPVTTVVADEGSAHALSDELRGSPAEVGVLLELDTGYHRCGLPADELRILAGQVGRLPHISVKGVMTYEGHIYSELQGVEDAAQSAYQHLVQVAADLRHDGYEVARVSVGASAGRPVAVRIPEITDVRWGSVALGDTTQVDVRSMDLESCAFGLVATVIANPPRGGFVIDAGAKALSYTPSIDGRFFGLVVAGERHFAIQRLADEQAMVDDGCDVPAVGSRVLVVPTAHAASIDCFDRTAWVTSNGWRWTPVDARGAR